MHPEACSKPDPAVPGKQRTPFLETEDANTRNLLGSVGLASKTNESRDVLSSTHRWPFQKKDGPGEWNKPHLNQGLLFFKQTNQKGHLCFHPTVNETRPPPHSSSRCRNSLRRALECSTRPSCRLAAQICSTEGTVTVKTRALNWSSQNHANRKNRISAHFWPGFALALHLPSSSVRDSEPQSYKSPSGQI